QIDPAAQQSVGVVERPLLPFVGAFGFGGIGHAPVRHCGLAGEVWTRFLRPVTHRDDQVPRLPYGCFEAAGRASPPFDAVRSKRREGPGMHPGRWLGAGTLGDEAARCLAIQQRLPDLAAGTVAGADEEDPELGAHITGFRARTKAPITHPLTSRASTSS